MNTPLHEKSGFTCVIEFLHCLSHLVMLASRKRVQRNCSESATQRRATTSGFDQPTIGGTPPMNPRLACSMLIHNYLLHGILAALKACSESATRRHEREPDGFQSPT